MGSKVLLADDSITIQKVVGIIFANEEYDLTIVATGDAAIQKACEIRPDVMLVDALMPGKNGYEVCREVRQNPALRHTAILLMTGAFEVVDEEKNRLSGADEFIIKPFESQALIDATNRLIALSAQRAVTPPPLEPSVEDVWATGFDTEPVVAAPPVPPFASPPPLPAADSGVHLHIAADDDLWGAFDLDSTGISPQPVQVQTPAEVTAADDFFSFTDEFSPSAGLCDDDDFVLSEVAVAAPQPEPISLATGFEPVGENEIYFEEVKPAPVQPMESICSLGEDDFSSLTFDEPEASPADVAPAAPVAPPVISPSPEAPAPLGEAQLKALLASLSREVIERIVWEVVPDLAETIIKEEIRKLKAGIA